MTKFRDHFKKPEPHREELLKYLSPVLWESGKQLLLSLEALGLGQVLVLTCHSCREGHQALQGSQPLAWKHGDRLRVVLPDQRDHQGSLQWAFFISLDNNTHQEHSQCYLELFLCYLLQHIFRFYMNLNLYTILGGCRGIFLSRSSFQSSRVKQSS